MNHAVQVRGGVCAPRGLLASHLPTASLMEKLPCVLLPSLQATSQMALLPCHSCQSRHLLIVIVF